MKSIHFERDKKIGKKAEAIVAKYLTSLGCSVEDISNNQSEAFKSLPGHSTYSPFDLLVNKLILVDVEVQNPDKVIITSYKLQSWELLDAPIKLVIFVDRIRGNTMRFIDIKDLTTLGYYSGKCYYLNQKSTRPIIEIVEKIGDILVANMVFGTVL